MHALVLPLLLALAGGKLAMALGGSGQGVPWDGDWATAYLGPGPWGSLAPAIPSYPSQVYEALATVGVLLVMVCLMVVGLFARRTGAAFLLGIALWAVARTAVASTWRDPVVVDPLRMEQVICLAIAAVALVLMALVSARDVVRQRSGRDRAGGTAGGHAGAADADVGADAAGGAEAGGGADAGGEDGPGDGAEGQPGSMPEARPLI
jgi:prolipoprotein diacylglyceryltransferase